MRSGDIEIELCPVLRPTEEEFNNFFEYVEKLEKQYYNKYGMVKVRNSNSGSSPLGDD